MRPYSDPVLRGRQTYVSLLSRLGDSGMLDYVTDPCEAVEKVGLFTVLKKRGSEARH